MRLLPIRALEASDVEWIKVIESKNCISACTGIIRRYPNIVYSFIIALKRPNNHTQIIVYEINRTRTRHQKTCEFTIGYLAQHLQILSDMRLVVAHQSGFTAYFLRGEATAMCKLYIIKIISIKNIWLTYILTQIFPSVCLCKRTELNSTIFQFLFPCIWMLRPNLKTIL